MKLRLFTKILPNPYIFKALSDDEQNAKSYQLVILRKRKPFISFTYNMLQKAAYDLKVLAEGDYFLANQAMQKGIRWAKRNMRFDAEELKSLARDEHVVDMYNYYISTFTKPAAVKFSFKKFVNRKVINYE